eukprot:CAMPEP_0203784136 /NCGR_PEP_ID=MMETSP0100_2-20121128/296_1 /ASSEMBLY_ACC=CAM_ASM_000210 /TAXON_ID=96639 /ORGANISM=" , Strain NY0313808BC1" /LENGTH=142 /DNA_ID=CAMNT_0050686079 /DNA_START=276 /DNA_END=704 /DNA_ORIENTATION=+
MPELLSEANPSGNEMSQPFNVSLTVTLQEGVSSVGYITDNNKVHHFIPGPELALGVAKGYLLYRGPADNNGLCAQGRIRIPSAEVGVTFEYGRLTFSVSYVSGPTVPTSSPTRPTNAPTGAASKSCQAITLLLCFLCFLIST